MIGPGSATRRAARGIVRRILRVPRLRAVVEAELKPLRRQQPRNAPTVGPPPAPIGTGVFIDRHGTAHPLDPGLRDRLKPSWRVMCDPDLVARPPSDDALRDRMRKAESNIVEAEQWLALAAGATLTGRILEIGCYDGASAFEVSKRAGTVVIASDLAHYYVVQRPGEPADGAVEAEQASLATLRERARQVAGVDPGRVEFVEDDVTRSRLDPGTLDAILSFEVLEHLADPDAAFASMTRLLRPGGVMYHDYNPFLSVNGGHSLVTLDVPWGHARFEPEQVERYLREIRPGEADQALRFYRESLNRMTLSDLRASVERAGLELLALVPWCDRRLVPQLPPRAIEDVRRTYPGATVDDLLATFVTVVARRPADAE